MPGAAFVREKILKLGHGLPSSWPGRVAIDRSERGYHFLGHVRSAVPGVMLMIEVGEIFQFRSVAGPALFGYRVGPATPGSEAHVPE